jgi:uncharacterized protein (DUF433 family)
MAAPADTLRIPLSTDGNGVVRVSGSRVTLHTIVRTFESGASAEEIAAKYPAVPLGDVYTVIAWYLSRREEVDEALAREDRESGALRTRIEGDPGSSATLRDVLLGRRSAK